MAGHYNTSPGTILWKDPIIESGEPRVASRGVNPWAMMAEQGKRKHHGPGKASPGRDGPPIVPQQTAGQDDGTRRPAPEGPGGRRMGLELVDDAERHDVRLVGRVLRPQDNRANVRRARVRGEIGQRG